MNEDQKKRYVEKLEHIQKGLKLYDKTDNVLFYSQCVSGKMATDPAFKQFVEEKAGIFCEVFKDGFYHTNLQYCKLFYDEHKDFSVLLFIESCLYTFVFDISEISVMFG